MKSIVLVVFTFSLCCVISCTHSNKITDAVDMDYEYSKYDSLPETMYDEDGRLKWYQVYSRFIRSKGEIAGIKIDTTIVFPDFSKYKQEKFRKSEYEKFQHFDLWTLEGYGSVDSTVFLYIKRKPNSIIIRFSDNTSNPMVLLKANGIWLLDYDYQINLSEYEKHGFFVFRRTIGFLTDSINLFMEEIGCEQEYGIYYNKAWTASKDKTQFLSGIELRESMKFQPGTKEFIDFGLNSPSKFLPKKAKNSQNCRYIEDNVEFFIQEDGDTLINYNSLILGSGGVLQERDTSSIHFYYHCLDHHEAKTTL